MSSTDLMSNFGCFSGVGLIFALLYIAGMWAMFSKAGKPGWAAIIPIYNVWVLCEVAGRPGWWVILFFIPLVNFVMMVIVLWDLSKAFGHGFGMFLGLFFLGFIFFPILGFGGSQYRLAPR